jgi:glycosyltransferase involved in cell wall biosynthesis
VRLQSKERVEIDSSGLKLNQNPSGAVPLSKEGDSALTAVLPRSDHNGDSFPKVSAGRKTAVQTVLFVIRTVGFGGLEVLLLDWLGGIDYSKTRVVVACAKDVYSSALARMGLPVECIHVAIPDEDPVWSTLPKWISVLSSVRPTKIIFVKGGFAHFNFWAYLTARFSAKRDFFIFESQAAEPLLKTEPGIHFGFLPGLGLWRHKRIWDIRLRGYLARHTWAASYGTRDKLIAHFGYPSRRISVLHHGVDTQRFCPSPAVRSAFRAANGIPEDAVVIVSHGRLDRNKRVDRIIRAFQELSVEHKNLWLLLTAHGPIREEVEQTIARIDERCRVKLLEFQEDVCKLVQASDIYVLASDNEGFGIALVEALATGLICVATDIPGPADIVVDGENGFLVAESDQGVLDGLKRALALRANERELMQRQARRTAVEKFELRDGVRRALESFRIPSR